MMCLFTMRLFVLHKKFARQNITLSKKALKMTPLCVFVVPYINFWSHFARFRASNYVFTLKKLVEQV